MKNERSDTQTPEREARILAWNKARVQAAREGRLPSEVFAETYAEVAR